MRGNEFLDKMELTDLKYVEAADEMPKKKGKSWAKWAVAAACFGVTVFVGALIINNGVRNASYEIPGEPEAYIESNEFSAFPPEKHGTHSSVSIGGIEREYADRYILCQESAVIWPWEYKTLPEKYSSVIINGKEYNLNGKPIDVSFIGNALGEYNADGYDEYDKQSHQMPVEVFEINGVSKEYIVAVRLGDEYYPAESYNSAPPANLGEMLDAYNLEEYVSFNRFSTKKGEFLLQDDAYIWEILNECRDAEYTEENGDSSWIDPFKKKISFYFTSDALGIYKMNFSVTSSGYIETNAFGYGYTFNIGKDAANKIISYATENGTKTETEPYTYSLAGTVTEIKDGYIFVDDSILCKDKSDGMVFKIPTDDLRISRCIDYKFIGIGVGDVVVVYFEDTVDVNSGNVVKGAYDMEKGYLYEDGVLVNE